jgi:hypothetical protein
MGDCGFAVAKAHGMNPTRQRLAVGAMSLERVMERERIWQNGYADSQTLASAVN